MPMLKTTILPSFFAFTVVSSSCEEDALFIKKHVQYFCSSYFDWQQLLGLKHLQHMFAT